MRIHLTGSSGRKQNIGYQSIIFTLLCTAMNVAAAYTANRTGLPLYFDTCGTILAASVGGFFPGVVTATATNVICLLFNENALFFAALNSGIALFAAWFTAKYGLKKPERAAVFALLSALICGLVSGFIQWGLFRQPQNRLMDEMSTALSNAMGTGKFLSFLFVNILLNVIDKGIAVALAVVIAAVMPEPLINRIRDKAWRQRPLSEEERKVLRKWSRETGFSSALRSCISLMGILLVSVLIVGTFGIVFYYDSQKEEKTSNARKAVSFAASVVDGNLIDEYISSGRAVPGYTQTEDMLRRIRDNSPGVKYLYVIKVKKDGCHVAFDLETEDTPACEPGDVIEFEKAFEPYIPTLLEGGIIGPVESDDVSGWVVTVYHPIKDSRNMTTGYACADVSIDYLAVSLRSFVFRILLIFAGFFILILSFQIRMSGMFTLYPIGSMALCVDEFSQAGDNQNRLDEIVKRIKKLDIRTGDEVEKLYREICSMASDQAEQVRSLKYYAETTAKMQDGLIMTMANMVENRDSDTGAHIQKTAAYVRIIAEGLKKKGYYSKKMTSKFISDVVRSAPLHDVGKINIPDEVLNKPGKLDDAEFEIMKTHTTAGKRILENAIDTTQAGNYLKEARNMAAYHHERWDGKGYPEGLGGEVIPLSARIMAVADVFDALTSPRVYKPAFPLEKALEIINDGAGKQFDPKVVEVFMDNLAEVKVILKKYNEQ